MQTPSGASDPPTAGDPDDPFAGLEGLAGLGGIPLIGDLTRMLRGAGTDTAGRAREVARAVATRGESEPNIDPSERIAVEQLMRVAELRVADATGLELSAGAPLRVEVVNRLQWTDRTVKDYDDLLAALCKSIDSGLQSLDDDTTGDPIAAMFAGVFGMLGPMMLSLATGAMVGGLGQRALGGYVLPVPRPVAEPLLVTLPNVDEFGRQWSLERDDLRLWVCLHEAVYHAVFGVEHLRSRLDSLLQRHARAFDSNPRRLQDLLDDFNLDAAGPEALEGLQAALSSPEAVLGAVRSPAQEALLPELTAIVAAVTGYVDHTMDRIGRELIGSYGRLTEALRRHRIEAGASERFVEQLLGLELDPDLYDRGAAFAAGVVERAGSEGLRRLFSDPANLPTPSEVDAAGLWLARIDLPR